ncbi:MAG TPA: hypothetical protein VNW97_05010 [Candidatus Saccharimonadales bacterium]|jgi:hypothetical protein|nr:hypothetical protein [Candidatus Saccharimonadales bacterium]
MTERDSMTTSKWPPAVFPVLALAVTGVLYRILVGRHLEQTSLLFLGIPGILATIMAFRPKAKTVTGGIMKAMTIFLLLSGPFLGEGFVCILMASPIFFLVAAVIGLTVDWSRKKRKSAILPCLALLGMSPLSFEGVHPRLSLDREESVTVTRLVAAPADEVAATLAQSPGIDLPLPPFGRLGFPRPVEAHGAGLEPGARRTIHFAGGEGHPGDLVMQVEESRAGHVRFVTVSDQSKIAHWMDWKSSDIDWSAVDATHTRVTWTLKFRRRLDPAWYFRPWERYAVGLAADYLIHANATPARLR